MLLCACTVATVHSICQQHLALSSLPTPPSPIPHPPFFSIAQWSGVHSLEIYYEDYYFQAWLNKNNPGINR